MKLEANTRIKKSRKNCIKQIWIWNIMVYWNQRIPPRTSRPCRLLTSSTVIVWYNQLSEISIMLTTRVFIKLINLTCKKNLKKLARELRSVTASPIITANCYRQSMFLAISRNGSKSRQRNGCDCHGKRECLHFITNAWIARNVASTDSLKVCLWFR